MADPYEQELANLSGRQLLARAMQMYGQQPDVTSLNEYAAQRQRQGQIDMVNALAAQYAGKGFQPVQETYLKRSLAAQTPQEIGDYGIVSGGKFTVSPFAGRKEQASALLNMGGKVLDNEEASLREKAADRRFEARLAATSGPSGGGKTMTERFMNTVLSGDASSPEYAMAWNFLQKPRTSIDPNTGQVVSIPGMDLSRFPKPVGATGPVPTVGASVVKPEGIRKAEAFEGAFDKQLEAFNQALKKTPIKEKALFATTGVKSPAVADSLGAYNMLVGMTRDESLLNTGVLQAGELQWINSVLTNPGTVSGLLSGNESTIRSFNQVKDFLKRKIAAKKSVYGQPEAVSNQASPQGSAPARTRVEVDY